MDFQVSVITSVYRGSRYLSGFFENLINQTIFSKVELILIHNEPESDALQIIASFRRSFPRQLKHIRVNPVESLGSSWNRGWQFADTKYLAIWNIDDQRKPNALEEQARALDQSSECMLIYGDFIEVDEPGLETGRRIITPSYSKKIFSRAFPTGGALFMWRKDLAEKIGYFDEQLKVGADFDFSVRVALNDLSMCRAESLLGSFTNIKEGLSTRENAQVAAVERTVIQIRYAIYDKIRPQYLSNAQRYRTEHVEFFGKWYHVSDFIPGYDTYIESRKYLWKIGKLKNSLRWILSKLGLLNTIYRFQDRFIRREI